MIMSLEQMKSVDITTVERSTLVDISKVRTDTALPEKERKLDYIGQIGNPYCFLVDDTVVKLVFNESGPKITECLESVFMKV